MLYGCKALPSCLLQPHLAALRYGCHHHYCTALYREWSQPRAPAPCRFVFCRQRQDERLRRGGEQKSLVVLSELPFSSVLGMLAQYAGPLYFNRGPVALQEASSQGQGMSCMAVLSWDPANQLSLDGWWLRLSELVQMQSKPCS